jgi:hypothetical protein
MPAQVTDQTLESASARSFPISYALATGEEFSMSEQRNGRVDELKFSWTRHGTNIHMVNIVRTSGYNGPAENRHSLVICGILQLLSEDQFEHI